MAVDVNVVSILPERAETPKAYEDALAVCADELDAALVRCTRFDARYGRALNAALQRVSNIRPLKRRSSVSRPESRGGILRRIEAEIANLDQWQKAAAIEWPEGPQRIRGLAGSGKTIVLALKAAYLHAQNPDWDIALTFYTRSLYQQLTDLVRRFTFDQVNTEPDWDKLHVVHAWGSASRAGLYADVAAHCGLPARDYMYARSTYGREEAFAGICREVLAATASAAVEPLYDAVLIDEGQDLPPAFFRLVHRFTRDPKRIVWACDELQNLTETVVPTVEELFGLTEEGRPQVTLEGSNSHPRSDIMLQVCYRNTPWALTVAHALGFGVCREGGLVQHFDDPSLWGEAGYAVVSGNLRPGETVRLRRKDTSYPWYFEELLNPDDAITTTAFDDVLDQAEWVADSIERNLTQDELEHDDVLVILPNVQTAQKDAAPLMDALSRRGIASHVAGVTESQDEFFVKGSIALSHIYRAKGNEAPMVYVVNCDYCSSGLELIRIRNTLFTAITRSKAWVRLCGVGEGMRELEEEIARIRKASYHLDFTIPTTDELAKLRTIHRDLTSGERAKAKRVERSLQEFVQAIAAGELSMENLPPPLRSALRRLLMGGPADHEDT